MRNLLYVDENGGRTTLAAPPAERNARRDPGCPLLRFPQARRRVENRRPSWRTWCVAGRLHRPDQPRRPGLLCELSATPRRSSPRGTCRARRQVPGRPGRTWWESRPRVPDFSEQSSLDDLEFSSSSSPRNCKSQSPNKFRHVDGEVAQGSTVAHHGGSRGAPGQRQLFKGRRIRADKDQWCATPVAERGRAGGRAPVPSPGEDALRHWDRRARSGRAAFTIPRPSGWQSCPPSSGAGDRATP